LRKNIHKPNEERKSGVKVLFCASEVVPFAKTGGLADVAGALPCALENQGIQVKVALPKYRSAKGKTAKMGKDIGVYLIENDQYFDRDELYGDKDGDYPDNLDRFSFFCEETLRTLKKDNFRPDIIHCNDWQTSLIPVYLKTKFKDDPFFKYTKSVFTVHNLAYQGLFSKEQFEQLGLDRKLFNLHQLEFYGKLNLLKAGLVFSRFITTVSPTYAQEIQTLMFGCGLDGILRERKRDLFGIINGLDYKTWNPADDKYTPHNYTKENLQDKYSNKEALQREVGLKVDKNVPLVGIVNRLAEQKGIDLIVQALDKISQLKLQFVILGTGDQKYHEAFEKINQKGYKNISINLRFDNTLAHKIYAGCDMFLIPSHYEPCGLGQLISFKYGTIPVVRKTGGLADTVLDYQLDTEEGNGFVFGKYSADAMFQTIVRAQEVYQNKQKWHNLVQKVMGYDFSWEASAREYIKLFQRAIKG